MSVLLLKSWATSHSILLPAQLAMEGFMEVLWGIMMTAPHSGRCSKNRFSTQSLCYATCEALLQLIMEYKVIKYLSFGGQDR